MARPANRPAKTAGLAIAAFMQQDFHKSTRSIDVSTHNLVTTNAPEIDTTALSTREMPDKARHTRASIYNKGELFPHPATLYKQFPQSRKLKWCVKESFHTSIFFMVREGVMSKQELATLRLVSKHFKAMVDDVPRLADVDFTSLQQRRVNYAEQEEIQEQRVERLSAAAVYYGLDFGLVTHYLGHEFTGKWRNVEVIMQRVSPLIDPQDAEHIKRILTEGCPAEFDFEEEHDNKMLFLERGNEPSVEQNQAVVQKTLNEEERNNHIIPFFGWLVFFSACAHHVPQSMLAKPGSKCQFLFSMVQIVRLMDMEDPFQYNTVVTFS